jgi:GDPmannose 4,6-dehydratase
MCLTVKLAECYNLADQSFVAYSFDDELLTQNTNINGIHYVLAALRDAVQAASSILRH